MRKQLDEEVDTPVRRSGAFYRSIAQLVVENLVHDRTAGDTYPADPLPLDVSVLRGLIRAGLTVKGIYDSIPRKGPTCSGMRERSASRVVFLPALPLPLGFTSVGFYDALPGFDLSDQCGEAWISTKGFQIVVLSHGGSSVGGQTVLNGVAQDRQGLVATTAQGCVAGEVVLGAGGDGMSIVWRNSFSASSRWPVARRVTPRLWRVHWVSSCSGPRTRRWRSSV